MKDFGLLFLSILFFSSLISCELEDEDKSRKPKPGYLNKMPEETSIGANTFGCYVNGELRASQGFFQEEGVESYLWPAAFRYVNGFWEERTGWLVDTVYTYMALGANIRNASIQIKIDATPFVGINKCEFYIRFRTTLAESGDTDALVDITRIDTIEHIISGRFDNIVIPMGQIDSIVHITQGQFDIKYGQNY